MTFAFEPAARRVANVKSTPLVEGDANDSRSHHAERARRMDREIDDPAANERPAIVDAALDRAAAIAHPDDAPEGSRAVSAGHAVARSAVVGSKSGFGRSG